VRAAGLEAGAGERLAAERLGAHDRADDVAVDVDVAGADAAVTRSMVSSMREWTPKVSP
jgi:hypothetical protein